MKSGGFLSCSDNSGLVLSTDGVPVFKSSKGSLWPVYLMITSIPPHQRMRMDNLIVAALWFGPSKPDMKALLHPILENISSINIHGIAVPGSRRQIRMKLILGIFDLPARAAATSTKQFNGEYGCLYCLDKGKIHNRARIYPPDDDHTLRTSTQMKEWAKEAEKSNTPKYGVKGISPLSDFLDLPVCIPIDYMHSILEGVFKQLMKLWFGPSYHSEKFSLRKHLNTINKLLNKIKPVNEIQRLPRPLDNMAFYKASEYRAWVLFYAFPILSVFLPPDYSHHLALLVSALHILLSESIQLSNLNIAHRMLSTFYQEAGNLYSLSINTANLHSLEHMVGIVELWGPIWAYSMFGFENLNGYLSDTFHGTRSILLQMSFNIQLAQLLPDKLRQLSQRESRETKAYLEKLLSNRKSSMHQIDDDCYFIGRTYLRSLNDKETDAIVSSGYHLVTHEKVQCYQRIMKAGIIYCSNDYLQSKQRNNTFCCFKLPTGTTIGYGQITGFYVLQNIQPLSIISVFQKAKKTLPFHILRPSRQKNINDIKCLQILSNQIIQVVFTQQLLAIPLKDIVNKCIHIKVPIEGQNAMYVIPLPNKYEVH